jgi:hypothetical protein
VLHESDCRMHLVIANFAEMHVTIITLNFGLRLAPVTLFMTSFPVPFDDIINIRAFNGALFASLNGASALAGEFFIESVLAGGADEGLTATG